MKIVFMGTPGFAIPSLKILHESKHEICAVVTTPDKERGRGQKITFTPVKQFAVENNLPVLQPENLRDENFISELKKFDADIFVIVAFRILPKEVYTIPKSGSFNLHGSLLPKYRGAAPIQWSIIKGEKETGVTTFFLQEKVDTGNIILQKKMKIEDDDNLGTIHDKMSLIGADAVLETVNLIESGNFKFSEQDNSLATPAPKITKENSKINWEKSAEEIHNLVRGLSPYPCAYFVHNEKSYKVFKTKIVESNSAPGEILQNKKEVIFGCGKNSISILELQPEGRKKMTIEEFLRGYKF